MARKVVILPDEMDKVIEDMSAKSGASVSEIMRRLIAGGLKEQGVIVKTDIEWGGRREGAGKPKQEKQPA